MNCSYAQTESSAQHDRTIEFAKLTDLLHGNVINTSLHLDSPNSCACSSIISLTIMWYSAWDILAWDGITCKKLGHNSLHKERLVFNQLTAHTQFILMPNLHIYSLIHMNGSPMICHYIELMSIVCGMLL